MESCDILVLYHLGGLCKALFLQDLVDQLQAEAEPPSGVVSVPSDRN